MKISALTLGGFKGIAQTAHIPLAPITLLFGANSVTCMVATGFAPATSIVPCSMFYANR